MDNQKLVALTLNMRPGPYSLKRNAPGSQADGTVYQVLDPKGCIIADFGGNEEVDEAEDRDAASFFIAAYHTVTGEHELPRHAVIDAWVCAACGEIKPGSHRPGDACGKCEQTDRWINGDALYQTLLSYLEGRNPA
jgi:hypothetical protein